MLSSLLLSLAFLVGSLVQPSQAALKDVFAHYMLGGMQPDDAVTDVQDAKALGIDAFAVNVQNTVNDGWAVNALNALFTAAEDNNFKLFFSFDMATVDDISFFIPLFLDRYTSSAYYKHNDLPFVSTFYGATMNFGHSSVSDGWQAELRDALSEKGVEIFFVPAFSNAPKGPTDFFSTYPVVDGVFSWDSSWPWEDSGNVNVSSSIDKEYLSGAKDASKTFMMGISPLQFKHWSAEWNWYRKGELNMALRIGQILNLSPDFVEIITWNDGGESHNIGNVWPDSIAGSPIEGYTNGYNHTAWQTLIPPLVKAFKAETSDLTTLTPESGVVSGAFWYRPLLTTATCAGSDTLGKPRNAESAEDTVNIALFIAEDDYGVTVYSGDNQIAVYSATKGLNAFAAPGLVAGPVRVEVWNAAGDMVTKAESEVDVQSDTNEICNYNYQTVPVSA